MIGALVAQLLRQCLVRFGKREERRETSRNSFKSRYSLGKFLLLLVSFFPARLTLACLALVRIDVTELDRGVDVTLDAGIIEPVQSPCHGCVKCARGRGYGRVGPKGKFTLFNTKSSLGQSRYLFVHFQWV